MRLRDYQEVAVIKAEAALSKDGARALLVAPTGTGKTQVMITLCKYQEDLKILVIYNRITLVEQLARQMSASVYCAGMGLKDLSNRITIASSQSLIRTKDLPKYDLVVVDEAHFNFEKLIKRILEVNPSCKFVGFTATPYDNKGYIYGNGRFYDKPCYQENMQWFIDNKYLVPAICKEPDFVFDTSKLKIRNGEYNTDSIHTDQDFIQHQVRDALTRGANRKKFIWFCCNIEHAETVFRYLLMDGELAVIIHSELPNYDDLKVYETTECRHLVFVSVVSTGYDYPPIDCCVLMRPTKSPGLYVQTVGRGLRISEGKENLLVLDYGNVVRELGPITDPVIDVKCGKSEAQEHKTCKECRALNSLAAKTCVECGFDFEKAKFEAHKKLMLEADERAQILKTAQIPTPLENKPPLVLRANKIIVNHHKAKSGNECLKVSYKKLNTNAYDFTDNSVDEYVVLSNSYRVSQLRNKLFWLGVQLPVEMTLPMSFDLDCEVYYRINGAFKEIINIKRITDDNRTS